MKLRLCSWNVNGLRAVARKGLFTWMESIRSDVVCFQETKAAVEQLSTVLTEPEGYRAYFSSAQRKAYSGVAIYSRLAPGHVRQGLGIAEFDNEGRVLVADYGYFVLLNIYFPNGRQSAERLDYKLRFYDAFLEYVEALRGAGRQVVVCGDVNTAHREIDIARPGPNAKVSGFLPIERAWVDRFVGCGYVDTFRLFNQEPGHYTWWDLMTRARERNVGWRIDYFYVSEGLRHCVTNAWIMPEVMGSDHCPIGLELDLSGEIPQEAGSGMTPGAGEALLEGQARLV